jgi:hypothetical protein
MTQGMSPLTALFFAFIGFPVAAIVMLCVLQRYCPKPQTKGDAYSRRQL